MRLSRLKATMVFVVVMVMMLSGMVILVENSSTIGNTGSALQSSVSLANQGTSVSHVSPPSGVHSSGTKTLSLSERMNLEKSVIQQAKQEGIPMKYLYLPDYMSQSKIENGHVTLAYASSPAPMGIGDYGLMNNSGNIVAYNSTTSSFMASVTLNNLSDFYLPDNSPQSVSMQLNAILNNVDILGNDSYNMWTQNVLDLSARTHTLFFIDNVWNFSSPDAVLEPGTILSSTAVSGHHGVTSTYHYGYSQEYTFTYPLTIDMYLNSTLVNGNSAVFFNISIPQDHVSCNYDEVVFNSTYDQPVSYSAPSPHYFVSGTQLSPDGYTPYDAEIMIGGPGGGSNADVSAINGTMNLRYMNATTATYENVQAAYDIGSETGETSTGVDVSYSGSTAYLQSGPSLVYGLWNNTYSQTKYSVDYSGLSNPLSSPFLFVQDNQTLAECLQFGWSPSDNFTLPTANYEYEALLNSYNITTGTLSNVGITNIAMVASTSLGRYTPTIAYSNGQLSAIASSGSGSSSDPYLIAPIGSNYVNLNPIFGQFNDFLYQVFPGILLQGTTAHVVIYNADPGFEYKGYWYDLVYEVLDLNFGFSLPTGNDLPTELYDASNVTISNGIFATWYYCGIQSTDGSMMIWNSTNLLITQNIIGSTGIGMLVYNSPYQMANITINGNIFAGYNVIHFRSETESIAQQLQFDRSFNDGTEQFGLQMYSSGNLIYGNNFTTQNPVYSPEYNFYCGSPAIYKDSWNSTTTGNQYWNYNLETPFNESGMIASGKDYFPDSYVIGDNVTFKTGLSQQTNISIGVCGLIAQGTNEITIYKLFKNDTKYSYFAEYGDPAAGSSSFTPNSSNFVVNLSSAKLLNSITFEEQGLPSGTSWSVTLNGTTLTSTSYSITFNESSGTYDYMVATSDVSYVATTQFGSVSVTQETYVGVDFLPAYKVAFNETGLPASSPWYVNISGMPASGPIINPTYTAYLANGSYSVSVNTSAKGYNVAYNTTFAVKGRNLSEQVIFSQVLYKVTFTETGLPASTPWYMNISRLPASGPIINPTYTVYLIDGSYNVSVSTQDKSYAPTHTSSFTVNGKPVSVAITFTAVQYKVTFTETGLPTTTPWYVNITGMASSGLITASSYSVNLRNDSYTYSVSTQDKSYAPTYTSSFTVNGKPVSVAITFTAVQYKVTFTETGLSSGSTWSVTINGQTNTTTSSSISVMEQNGTYSYSVSTTNTGYKPSVPTSTFSVSGSSIPVSVTFTQVTVTQETYNVTFTESGLSSGSTWYLNLSDGKSLSSTSTTITVSLANGTYSYTATSSGYNNLTGSVSVNGHNQSISVAFTKVKTPTTPSSSNDTLYIAVGVVAAVIVIGAVALALRKKK
ncbi:MAG: thermopsin [Candidatus Thermoplasmatota archaeon]|nr:thermopsin [Candidatus Thermoplasmatota archaeon]